MKINWMGLKANLFTYNRKLTNLSTELKKEDLIRMKRHF